MRSNFINRKLHQQKQLEMDTKTFKTLIEKIPTTNLEMEWDCDYGDYYQENDEIEIQLNSDELAVIDVNINATIEGYTIPGTYEDPPEFVETNRNISIDINSVWVNGDEESENMSDDQWSKLEETVKNSINF